MVVAVHIVLLAPFKQQLSQYQEAPWEGVALGTCASQGKNKINNAVSLVSRNPLIKIVGRLDLHYPLCTPHRAGLTIGQTGQMSGAWRFWGHRG